MTENANPKPFNISRLKCYGRNKLERTALLWVYQSINQKMRLPSNWLNIIQIKDCQKCKRVVYRLC